jgi:hypothetical protein
MKNLSSITQKLYTLSLFNHKASQNFDTKPRLFMSCSLIQKGMHKKNLFNFIFFIYLVTNLKPKLRVALNSNALLNIRKGSLIESYVRVDKVCQLQNLFYFFNFEKDFYLKLKNEISKSRIGNSYKLDLGVRPKNSHQ